MARIIADQSHDAVSLNLSSSSNISNNVGTDFSTTFDIKRASPNIIIKSAFMIAMSSLNRMAQVRKNRHNQTIVESINRIYRSALEAYRQSCKEGKPDFSILKRAESSMRKQYLRLFWIRLNRYGYPIGKRIHNENEGELDDFNRILNIGGAILREFFEIRYALPSIYDYDYAIHSGENVIPSHPFIPSLDIAEIFRTHIQELAFTMFIRNVPVNKVRSYFLSFLHSCKDLADWIYAGGRQGINSKLNSTKYVKKSFRFPKYIDRVLREHKEEIKNSYIQIGRYITSKKMKQLKKQNQTKNITVDELIKYTGVKGNNKVILKNYITSKFVDNLLRQKEIKSRTNGDKFHKILFHGLPHPYSLKEIIRNGDKYNIHNLPILIVSELTLTNYISTKRPDLVVFAKLDSKNWVPIAVIDVKTQFDYLYTLRGKRRNKSSYDIYPVFSLKSNELSSTNWNYFGLSELRRFENQQINEYAYLIKQEYKRLTDQDITLIKGIIRIAPCTNKNQWYEYQQEMLDLISNVLTNLIPTKNRDQTVFFNNGSTKKLSLVVDIPPHSLYQSISHLSVKHILSPFTNTKYTLGNEATREHILYLFAKSNTSAGYSSAWIASYYHLIPYVVKQHPVSKIAMIDLVSMFKQFPRSRLRSDKSKYLRKYFNKIDVIDIFHSDHTSYRDIPEFDIPKDYDVYIVSGWEMYKYLIYNHEGKVIQLELINKIPTGSILYWIDEAKVGSYTSRLYHQRAIEIKDHKPSEKTKIIFNLPVAPKKAADNNPQYSDARIIVEWGINHRIKCSWQSIPTLRGHSSKFVNRRIKQRTSKFGRDRADRNSQRLKIDKAFDLLPWLQNKRKNTSDDNFNNYDFISDINLSVMKAAPNALNRVERQLNNLQYKDIVLKSRSSKFVDISLINSKRIHKPAYDYSYLDPILTTFPIHRNLFRPASNLDDLERREMIRLHDTISFLRKYITEKFESEGIVYLLDLFSRLDKVVCTKMNINEKHNSNYGKKERNETNNSQQVLGVIKEWEIDYDESLVSLLSILEKRRLAAYYRHIFHVSTSPDEIKNDRDFFLKYGNANYLLLQVLYYEFPELNTREINQIWDDLLPFTLQLIGFTKSFVNLMKTQYNTHSIWNHLCRKAHYITKNNFDQPVLGRTDGFVLNLNDGYSWLWIEGYDPILYRNDGVGFENMANQGLFKTIIYDEGLKLNKTDIPNNRLLRSTTTTRYKKENYIWVYSDEARSWNLVGILKLNKIRYSKIINSFEITNYSIQSSEIPKPEEEPDELDYETILDETSQITRPELFLNFTLDKDKNVGFIDINYYLKEDVDKARDNDEEPDFGKLTSVDGDYFTNSYDMIRYLREKKHDPMIEVGGKEYRFDPVNNTNWRGWIEIKELIQSYHPPKYTRVKRDGLEFIKDFEDLLFMEPFEFEIVLFFLSHDPDKCRLRLHDMQHLRNTISKLASQRQYDKNLYESTMHHQCFELRIAEGDNQLSSNTLRKLKSKFNGLYTGRKLLKLLIPSLQKIDGIDELDHVRIQIEIADKGILAEDKHVRTLLGIYYDINLYRRPPASYLLVTDYQLNSIKKSGTSLFIHYRNIVTDKTYYQEIVGSSNPCLRSEDWELGLIAKQKLLFDLYNFNISETSEYIERLEIITNHNSTCDDPVHDPDDSDGGYLPVKGFVLENEGELYSVVLQGDKTLDTRDTIPRGSYTMSSVELSDLADTIINILKEIVDMSHVEFLSEIQSHFDFTYPHDTDLIEKLFDKFISLVDIVDDEVLEILGPESDEYLELQRLDYAVLELIDVDLVDDDIEEDLIQYKDLVLLKDKPSEMPPSALENIKRIWEVDLDFELISGFNEDTMDIKEKYHDLVSEFNENNQYMVLKLSNELIDEIKGDFTPIRTIYMIQAYWIQYLTYFRINDLLNAKYCLDQIEEIFDITSDFNFNENMIDISISTSTLVGIEIIDFVRLLIEQGWLFYRMRQYNLSLARLDYTFELIKKSKTKQNDQLIKFYNIYANTLLKLSQFERAIEFYFKQLELLVEIQTILSNREVNSEIEKTHRNIARTYNLTSSFTKSNEHCVIAEGLAHEFGDFESVVKSRDRRISIQISKNQLLNAYNISNGSLQILRSEGVKSPDIIAYCYYRHINILSNLDAQSEMKNCLSELKMSFVKHYNALQDLPAFILASEIGDYKDSSILEIHEILSNSSYSDAYRIDALLLMIKLVLEKELDEKLINLDLEIVNVLIPQMRSEIQLEIREIVNSIQMKLKYKNKIINRDKKLDFVRNQLLLREYVNS